MAKLRTPGRNGHLVHALELAVAVIGLRLVAPSFVCTVSRSLSSSTQSLRGPSTTALRADDDEGGGFMSFLKVEADIELSPEEYKVALEQEMEAQRKKYYIGGVIKKSNLVVPWKPVDEVQVEKDGRRQLRKNGILDPTGEKEMEAQDSDVTISLVGTDVRLDWLAGVPGNKVGYIVERKRSGAANFKEIATYDNLANPPLLAKQYAGHQYQWMDELVPPGKYTYRVLCRVRTGDISVVDQKDILVPEPEGLNETASIVLIFAVVAFLNVYGYMTTAQPEF